MGLKKPNKETPTSTGEKNGSSASILLTGIEDLHTFQGKLHNQFPFLIPQPSFQYGVGRFFGKKTPQHNFKYLCSQSLAHNKPALSFR